MYLRARSGVGMRWRGADMWAPAQVNMCLCVCACRQWRENKVGELLCSQQVTGCHGPHSWQNGFEKLLWEGPVCERGLFLTLAQGHLKRKWLLFHHNSPVYERLYFILNTQDRKIHHLFRNVTYSRMTVCMCRHVCSMCSVLMFWWTIDIFMTLIKLVQCISLGKGWENSQAHTCGLQHVHMQWSRVLFFLHSGIIFQWHSLHPWMLGRDVWREREGELPVLFSSAWLFVGERMNVCIMGQDGTCTLLPFCLIRLFT